MTSRISTVPRKLNLSFLFPDLSITATPPPVLMSLSISSSPVTLLPEIWADWRLTTISLSSNRKREQCRLAVLDVAEELAVEMEDKEAEVDA